MKLLRTVKNTFNYMKANTELKLRICIGVILGQGVVIGLFFLLTQLNCSEEVTYLIIALYMIFISVCVIMFGYILGKHMLR